MADQRKVGVVLDRLLEPLTCALSALAVLGVALGASWIPAARAASVEPTRALRTE